MAYVIAKDQYLAFFFKKDHDAASIEAEREWYGAIEVLNRPDPAKSSRAISYRGRRSLATT